MLLASFLTHSLYKMVIYKYNNSTVCVYMYSYDVVVVLTDIYKIIRQRKKQYMKEEIV